MTQLGDSSGPRPVRSGPLPRFPWRFLAECWGSVRDGLDLRKVGRGSSDMLALLVVLVAHALAGLYALRWYAVPLLILAITLRLFGWL